MTENKGKETPQNRPDDEDDVEGHMMINPAPGGDLARMRSKEVERAVQQRKRVKEAKR